MSHQADFLQPAIMKVWDRNRTQLWSTIRENETPLVLGGDGRSDSPGHCAKYGSYTFMDIETAKVIDVELVQVTIN